MPLGARKKAPELPTGPKGELAVRTWTRLLDPTRTSVKGFIESYMVPTKRVRIGEMKSNLVPYREYPLQSRQREVLEDSWRQGRGAKLCSGKGRQEGMTTCAALLLWERFMRGGGGTGNVFSYDTDATKETLRLFHSLRKQTPDWVFTHLMHGGGGSWVRESALQLQVSFPDGTDCLIQCLTAGDKSSGSGSSPRWLLWDEFPKWDSRVKRDPTSMSEGWTEAPGNFWIVQGTGQGQDEYAEFFTSVWDGTNDSGFVAIFPERGWLGHPDRVGRFEKPHDKARLMAAIGKDRHYGIAQEEALLRAGATAEELLWRRQKVSGIAFRWDLSLFSQEFPLVPSDMFQSRSRSVFYAQMEILKSHEVPARERERRAVVGEFEFKDKKTVFIEVPHGTWVLLEEPAPDGRYCFGVDPSSGKTPETSVDKDPDYAAGAFLELHSGRSVARYRGHMEGRALAVELFKVACFFNGARGFIERNQYGEATIYRFEEQTHGKYYGKDLLLMQEAAVLSDGRRLAPQTGFTTTVKTRALLIDIVREYLEEVGIWSADRQTPLDSLFIGEALLFERNEKGKEQAARGHDDVLFATAFALKAREDILREAPIQSKVAPKVKLPGEEMIEYWKHLYDQERRKSVSTPVDHILGRGF